MVRKIKYRNTFNRARKSRLRTFINRVLIAVKSGNKDEAMKEFIKAQPEIHRSYSKGIIKKNNSSNKIRRLSLRIKNMVS